MTFKFIMRPIARNGAALEILDWIHANLEIKEYDLGGGMFYIYDEQAALHIKLTWGEYVKVMP